MKWFQESIGLQFGSEKENLLEDIVRYVVVNILPSNEVIVSDILQRFVLIGSIVN